MRDHDKMLEEVLLNPTENGPRSRYADWLLHHDIEAGRGEFIHLQLLLEDKPRRHVIDEATLFDRGERCWELVVGTKNGNNYSGDDLEVGDRVDILDTDGGLDFNLSSRRSPLYGLRVVHTIYTNPLGEGTVLAQDSESKRDEDFEEINKRIDRLIGKRNKNLAKWIHGRPLPSMPGESYRTCWWETHDHSRIHAEYRRGFPDRLTCKWDTWASNHNCFSSLAPGLIEDGRLVQPISKINLASDPEWAYFDSDMTMVWFPGVAGLITPGVWEANELPNLLNGDNDLVSWMLGQIWPHIKFSWPSLRLEATTVNLNDPEEFDDE